MISAARALDGFAIPNRGALDKLKAWDVPAAVSVRRNGKIVTIDPPGAGCATGASGITRPLCLVDGFEKIFDELLEWNLDGDHRDHRQGQRHEE